MGQTFQVLQWIGVGIGLFVMLANLPRPSKGRADVAVRLCLQVVGLAIIGYAALGFPGIR